MNILIVLSAQKELDGLRCGLAACGWRPVEANTRRLPLVLYPTLGITLACGGNGKAQFAAQMQHLLDALAGVDLAICSGAAGGLADEVAVGDVVVATATVEHDYNNHFTNRPAPCFAGAEAALTGLRRAAAGPYPFKVHLGVIASGDEDIVDALRRQDLQRQTGALAVAWEGAGGARACAFSGVPFIEIRGITDAANQHAPVDFQRNLPVAMANVAALLLAWIGTGE